MRKSRRNFIIESSLLTSAAALNLPLTLYNNYSSVLAGDRLVLLGTQGGPFIRSYKQTPSSNLVVFKSTSFIIDTGYGVTFKLLESGFKLTDIKNISITHHHSDHNLELGMLLYNAWIAGLQEQVNVYGPPGLHSILSYFWLSNQYDIELRIKDEGRPDIRKLVISHEISEGIILTEEDIIISALKNFHPPVENSYAYKFKLDSKLLVFSGDTTYFPKLASFAAEADYLIHEVIYGPGVDEMLKKRPNNAVKLKASILSHHTLAEDVGRIAAQANAKNLILNHFIPPDENLVTEETWINAVKQTYSGNIIVGKDLLQIKI